jgi:hypothetical protein
LFVLTYTVRLPIKPSFKLDIHKFFHHKKEGSFLRLHIHNRCLNANLIFPVHVIDNNLECHKAPDKVYAGNIMRSDFIIKSGDKLYGALIYRLQRKQTHGSTEISNNISNATHLLVVWDISTFKNVYIDVLLVESDRAFTWNEGDLRELHYRNLDQIKEYNGPTSNTWFMDNNMALKTSFKVRDLEENLELNITISEEKDGCAMRPIWINTER